MYQTIEFSVRDRIAQITLNRPEAGNALNPDLARDLARAALACDQDRSIKAVLLSANGRMFCSGGDLKAMRGFGEDVAVGIKQLADDLHKAISLLCRMEAPLVIAVNGAAAGAGFSLALIGDIVLAAETARFTMAYTAAGLSPDGSSTWFLPRLVGMRRAQELALTNRSLSAQEALAWGLITQVVSDDALHDAAMSVCQRLAAGPAQAQATVKALLRCALANGLEQQMEIEGRAIARAGASPDGREGVLAFIEKRKPVFQ